MNQKGKPWSDIKRVFNKPPRDPRRIERILWVLGKVWRANPDLRLEQLLDNARTMRRGIRPGQDVYYYEDAEVLEDLKHYLKNQGVDL